MISYFDLSLAYPVRYLLIITTQKDVIQRNLRLKLGAGEFTEDNEDRYVCYFFYISPRKLLGLPIYSGNILFC